MTEKPPPTTDYNALAKRYLDLWQEQVAKLARDPGQLAGTAAEWSHMAASMMQNAAASPQSASQPSSQSASSHDGSTKVSSAPGSASPGSASAPGGVDPADILGRLDALERRIAALESTASGKPSKSAQRSDGAGGQRKSRNSKPPVA